MVTTLHKSDFVNVNGIRLHFLDWGGSGPALVFIPGWGCTPHLFGRFAPRFTDRFHVLGITRRGHGDSDYPDSGYDPDTLAEDLRQFLDSQGIDRVILAGHSLAYIELTHFSTLYPKRVIKLVFLDAIYDRTGAEFKTVNAKNPLPGIIPPWPAENPASVEEYTSTIRRLYPSLHAIWCSEMDEQLRHSIQPSPAGGWVDKETEAIHKAIQATVDSYDAPYTALQPPLLSIFALLDGTDFLSSDYMSAEQKAQVLDFFKSRLAPYIERSINQFQRAMPQARVSVIPHGHHYCFLKHEEIVYDEMRRFLLESDEPPRPPEAG